MGYGNIVLTGSIIEIWETSKTTYIKGSFSLTETEMRDYLFFPNCIGIYLWDKNDDLFKIYEQFSVLKLYKALLNHFMFCCS